MMLRGNTMVETDGELFGCCGDSIYFHGRHHLHRGPDSDIVLPVLSFAYL